MIEDDRSLAARELERPEPGPGQVRVRVAACGICGSDLHLRPSPALPAGTVMGHELAGVVEARGDGVDPGWDGARVCVYPFEPVDRHDLDVALGTGVGMGGRPGGFAESVVVDERMLWRLPDGLELEHGALVEPLAVALHGLDVGEVRADDRVAVLGAGPIGVMCALALRGRGVADVVVVERDEPRRERAERLGFRAVGLDGVHEAVAGALGGLPRVVLECAGHPSAPGLGIELIAPSGIVVLLGVLEEPVPINQLLLSLKEGQLRASFAYRPRSFDEAIELLASGRVPAAELITARAPLDDAAAMFAALERPGTEHLKVLLRP